MRNNSATKLTKDQVKQIRMLLRDGALEAVIATEFGLIQSSISKIKTRKSWSDVA